MKSLYSGLITSLFVFGLSSWALAEDGKPGAGAANAASSATPRPVLTGKERLGRKWTDEQRIDNCRVPVDKRGAKPRPSACADAPPS